MAGWASSRAWPPISADTARQLWNWPTLLSFSILNSQLPVPFSAACSRTMASRRAAIVGFTSKQIVGKLSV